MAERDEVLQRPTTVSPSIILPDKPMSLPSQFTPKGRWPGLAGVGLPAGVYAAGRA